jgi:hypothetical protein
LGRKRTVAPKWKGERKMDPFHWVMCFPPPNQQAKCPRFRILHTSDAPRLTRPIISMLSFPKTRFTTVFHMISPTFKLLFFISVILDYAYVSPGG